MSEMEKKKNKAAGVRKRKKKIPLIVAAALVVVFGGYSVVNSVIAKNTPTQVNTITAAKGSVEETISTSGKVNSEQSRTYYAPVGAVITEMNVSLGDVVEEGQQLVTFDTSDLEAQKTKAALDASASANGYRSTQYQSDKKQSEYNEAVIGLDELKVLAAGQEQYVQGLKYNLEDDIQNKKEDLQEWLNKLNLELEIQNNKLSEPRSEESRERIQETIQNLNESIRSTSNEINDLSMSDEMKEKQRIIDAEQKKLDDMKEEISRREGKESSSEAGIVDPYAKQQQADNMQSARITAEEAAEKLAKGQEGVKAEFGGIVTKIATMSSSANASAGGGLLEGATVSEGTELFTIESNQQVKVDISITKYDLAKIAVGQKADITIADQKYEGEVTKINKVAANNAQGSPVVGVEVHINNPDSGIYLGVEAQVVIHTNSAQDVITLPVEIVNTDRNGDFCYVVENGVVTMRRITTGISSDTDVEVTDGLKEGDLVVYDMTGSVTEGMSVVAVPAAQESDQTPAASETEASGETAVPETEASTETESVQAGK
ncbi:MAG TPA: HlyD family efflux transporter periplasmic adaptor subunit [Candidatus Eisenbergiella intestinigallinarum]|uniref:HlyD family efflux transporter periplasmic adaptor subunit n=1 Tax=Candidatus Eisenbergiella intestinigallinarum TaxID=2838549 RepID=A0A9D2QIM9_9FIRM|nr:HlyD family efflux transporter periplasmic adaptor subunit [Candidatus Eisenbergiella intestinigallinarum]